MQFWCCMNRIKVIDTIVCMSRSGSGQARDKPGQEGDMKSKEQSNVLLVDDKPENLLALESVLSELGQNLICATSAREALRFMLIEDVAVILLDVQMPGLNGFELAELIREREKTQDIPIIFISATGDEQFVFKGYSLGAVDYITKPFQPEILRSKVTFFTKLFQQHQKIKQQALLLEQANAKLDSINSDLEEGVRQRTEELEIANRELQKEITVRKLSEARLTTEHFVTRTLADAEDLDAAISVIFQGFCEHLGAAVVSLWELNEANTELHCSRIEPYVEGIDLFVKESKKSRLVKGNGLPGQVWLTNAPAWLPDTMKGEMYPRAKYAAAVGLQSSLGFPIRIGKDFYGVIEFSTRSPLKADQSLVNMVEAIGSEIGQFIQKKRVETDRENLLKREKNLRSQAEMASRLKDEFLATVSHELRTPLNSILGWGQILSSGSLTGDEQKTALETIHRNATSQAQLIDELLDTSRLITGNLMLDLAPTRVISTIEAAIEVVKPAAEAKGISINTTINTDVETITCDTRRLQQMVWNLLTNAVKFTPEGGRIDVVYESDSHSVRIIIKDTGRGISPDFLPFVFDRFRQADSSSTRKHAGLGLGLAIVRHLAELHGGSASVRSEGEGTGAEFTLTLPLTLTATSEPARDYQNGNIPQAASETELDGLKILVVDDDLDACRMLTFALKMLGADVDSSSSAAEAFGFINKQPPDILLTDINMPGEDGISLLKRLRNLTPEQGADIPAIALTALARPEDGERVLSAGFQLHMPKPIEIDELTSAIRRLTRHNGIQTS